MYVYIYRQTKRGVRYLIKKKRFQFSTFSICMCCIYAAAGVCHYIYILHIRKISTFTLYLIPSGKATILN